MSLLFLVFGSAIIIWQMIGDSKRFPSHDSNTIKNWIKNFPRLKPRTSKININSVSEANIATKVHVRISISKEASLEEKINYLLQQKENMETSIINLDDKLDNKIAEINNKLKKLEKKIIETENIINSTISDVTIGNYDLKLFSIVLMICGTFIQLLF